MLSLLLIFRIRQGVWRALCLLFCLTALPAGVYAASADDERDSLMRHLKDMDLGALMEVETSLDDTFDLFEGLIAARRVTVATGEDQDMAKAPSVTTVITARDMEAMGAETIDEVLETVPGLHVGRDGGYDSVLYTFRGIHSPPNNQQTLVLINGIPLTSALTRSMNFVWSDMLVNAISRIEVIRGPGSAVYGADAFAGVINIITKTKEDIDGTEAGLRGGSFGTGGGWILHGGAYGGVDVAGALQFQTTDGHEEIMEVDAQTGMDEDFGTNASYAPGPVNVDRQNIDARLDLSKGNWQLRAGWKAVRDSGTGAGLAALDPQGGLDSDRTNADLTWHDPYFTENWDVTAQLSYLDSEVKTGIVRIFPPGAFGGALPDGFMIDQVNADRNIRVGLSGFYAGFEKHLIRVGTGYHLGDLYEMKFSINSPADPTVTLQDAMPEVDGEDWYAYIQDIWSVAPDWELTTGLRYDNYPDVRETFNPRLALVWQTHPNLSSKFLYGRAFRAPSFMELHDTSDIGGSIGNPNVEPETLEVLELAFDWRAMENLNLAINVFTHKWRDRLIVTPLSGKSYGQVNNAGEQKGRGTEFEARWKMSAKSSLLFNYSFQDSEDGEGNDPGGAPRHQAHLRTDWLFAPNWFLDAKLNWVADRKRGVGDNVRPKIDDYTTVDMTVRRKEKNVPWNFAVGVRNLFDADVREPTFGAASASYPLDYPLAGRSYWAEIRYRY